MKTKVIHSESKSAWNVVGEELGGDYKIARIPYLTDIRLDEEINSANRKNALKLAKFISKSLLNFQR